MALSDAANVATIVTSVLVAGVGFFQWHLSEDANERRSLEERERETRRRDAELLSWGNSAISCMAKVEVMCRYWPSQKLEVERLAAECSALVDQGRLFFPNIPAQENLVEPSKASSRGWRVALLDELVRAYLLTKLAAEGAESMITFVPHIRAARRQFVEKLQLEMSGSLRRLSRDKIGESVPKDPHDWELDANYSGGSLKLD